jgi:hypothetical protein
MRSMISTVEMLLALASGILSLTESLLNTRYKSGPRPARR